MKIPGILHRISILIILQSILIFAAVTIISMENNQARINRLIEYKFDTIGRFFNTELEAFRSIGIPSIKPGEAHRQFDSLFDAITPLLEGLGGIALLEKPGKDAPLRLVAMRYTASDDSLLSVDFTRLLRFAEGSWNEKREVVVGNKFDAAPGKIKPIFIRTARGEAGGMLAFIFLPTEIVGSDAAHTTTLIILFLGITLVSLLMVNLLVKKYIEPLQQVSNAMERTAQGELGCQVAFAGADEIGRVASAYNAMSDALAEKRRLLTESNDNLVAANNRLSDTLDKLSEANKSLAESESFLSKLIENAPFAVIATDAAHNILIFSQPAMNLFDVPPDVAMRCNLGDYFPFVVDKIFPIDGQEHIVLTDEMICRKYSGEEFPAYVSRVPIRDEKARISAYLFIIRDISESKGFQEMLISIDRMATRGVMAGEVAHEINNYLAVILGNVELLPLLLAKGDMDKVEKKLDVLKNSVAKIQRFAEGLGSETGEVPEFHPNDLNQLIGNLIAFIRPQNHYDSIEFHIDLSRQLPLVELDSGQMQQMLINLLNNAATALKNSSGKRSIVLSTGLDADNNAAVITVTDTAGGLPDDIHDEIFISRYSGKRNGRGFGLVIVKRIVDSHSGIITCDSRPGDGTTFRISIPLKHPAEAEVESAQAADQVSP